MLLGALLAASAAIVLVLCVALRTTRLALAKEEQQHAQKWEQLNLALDGADEALWDWNISQNRTYYSERWSRMLGFTPDEVGESVDIWEQLVHPSDLVQAMDRLRVHMDGHCQGYEAEFRMQAKDGGWRWIRARGRVVARSEDGFPLRVAGTHLDITPYKLAEQALHREQVLLRTLIDSLPDLIYVKDTEGRFVVINEALRKTLRVNTQEEAFGKTDFDFFPHGMAAQFRADEVKVLQGEPLVGHEEQVQNAEGHPAWLLTTKASIRDAEGKVVGLVGLSRDISELRRAREAVEASARLKSEFLANMSHEIRTPLNGLMGMTQLALDTDLTAEQRGLLETAYRSANSLLNLLNALLDFSRMEAGNLSLECVEFRLDEVMHDAFLPLADAARQKGLDLNYTAAPDMPVSFLGDPRRLMQVVTNLIDNAIKFTGHGKVSVSSRVLAGDLLEISVTDTGIGIPLAKQQGIFDVFTQADGSTTRRYEGTGLGLSICSRLVSLMKGVISVDSIPGKGSTFRFTASLAAVRTPAAGSPDSVARMAALRGRHALIVDDNETNRHITGSLATSLGMRTQLSAGGHHAVTQVREAVIRDDPFDILLLDVQMPGMDGFDLAAEIRALFKAEELVIMMLSSVEVADDVARCRELGIHRYLTKPISKAELGRALAGALANRPEIAKPATAQLRALASSLLLLSSPVAPLPPTITPARMRDIRPLRVLVVEDNAVNQKFVTRVVAKLGHHVTLAVDGEEALHSVRNARFDIVLMDIQMPRMDGLTATRSIRQFEMESHLPAVPIIALTALAMGGDREKCLEAGMNDCLCKPFHVADLEQILRRYGSGRSVCNTGPDASDRPSPADL
ncbi:MAG: response regulator [Candidatus Solibacter usitatus]|nr:response regulator [Candidatus Solibacter usitatus]